MHVAEGAMHSSEFLQVVGVLWELPKVSSYVFAPYKWLPWVRSRIERTSSCLTCVAFNVFFCVFFNYFEVSSCPILVICDHLFKQSFQVPGFVLCAPDHRGLSLNKVANPFEHTLMVSVKLDVLIIGIREGEQITNLNWLRYIQRPLFKSKILNEKTSYLEFWFFIRFFISVMLWDYCKCHSWRGKKNS